MKLIVKRMAGAAMAILPIVFGPLPISFEMVSYILIMLSLLLSPHSPEAS
jgi:VIT1/CCC1 family predicted Fe2+/Mn2+ transporter